MLPSHLICTFRPNASITKWSLPLLILMLPYFFCLTFASAATKTLTFAIKNADFYPWTMKDATGADLILIRQAAANAQVSVNFISYPWKRCLLSLRENRIDGVFPVSYKTSRTVMGVYPLKANGTVDDSKRLHTGSYSLYVKKDSDLRWDGRRFINLKGKIGVPGGYSIIDELKRQGADIAEVSSSETLIKMVALGRLQGGATTTAQGNHLLKDDASLSAKIKTNSPPLVEKNYFLLFSHEFVNQNEELAETLWKEIQRLRESGEAQKLYDNFVNR